jgi:GDPmannose 4,6-dehydratase
MNRALVIGSNGQDGTFLVRHLLGRAYEVAGVDRHDASRWPIDSTRFRYYSTDLREVSLLSNVLVDVRPDLIFHVAAVHTSAGGTYETVFGDVLKVNVGSVHEVLEYLRERQDARFLYASSAKVFGFPLPPMIDETTPIANQDLYSISKNAAGHLIEYYRKNHGIRASIVYLFNHESELRPIDFFIPTIVHSLASALQDRSHTTRVNSLEFYCDWGSAEEYSDIMIEILERLSGQDFTIARGCSSYARGLVQNVFELYGLDYRNHIMERTHLNTPFQPDFLADNSKLRRSLGRSPECDILQVCQRILHAKYGSSLSA